MLWLLRQGTNEQNFLIKVRIHTPQNMISTLKFTIMVLTFLVLFLCVFSIQSLVSLSSLPVNKSFIFSQVRQKLLPIIMLVLCSWSEIKNACPLADNLTLL